MKALGPGFFWVQSSRWWKLETTSQGSQQANLAVNRAAAAARKKAELLDTDLRNFYLQITALILEILQPLVVQFLVVSHVSSCGCGYS